MNSLRFFIKYNGIIGTIIGIIGFILSIIFYVEARQAKEVSYIFNTPTKIFNNQNSLPTIRVIDKNGNVVSGNVFLNTVTIWNSGNLPINQEEVREPITIEIVTVDKIIDVQVKRENRENIMNCEANATLKSSIVITWTYFDPRFGCEIQFMYTSNDEFGGIPKIGGYVVGVDQFNNVTELAEFRSQERIIFYIYLIFMGIIFFWFVYIQVRAKRRILEGDILSDVANNVLIIMGIMLLILLIYMSRNIYLAQTKQPPF